MKCKNIKTQLSYYVDGECSGSVRQTVSEHLAGCAVCREEVRFYKSIKKSLEDLPVREPSDGYFGRFAERLKHSDDKAIYPVFRKTFIRVAAVAMVVFFVGVLFKTKDIVDLPVASVTYISGTSFISQDSSPTRVVMNNKILSGQMIYTGPNSIMDIEMPGRFKVTLKENSVLEIIRIEDADDKFVFNCKLSEGLIIAEVTKRKNLSDFQVATDLVRVKVCGTQFMVKSSGKENGGDVSVAVLDGAVEVVHNEDQVDEEHFMVRENQKMIFGGDGSTRSRNKLSQVDFETLCEVHEIGKRGVDVKRHSGHTPDLNRFRSK